MTNHDDRLRTMSGSWRQFDDPYAKAARKADAVRPWWDHPVVLPIALFVISFAVVYWTASHFG